MIHRLHRVWLLLAVLVLSACAGTPQPPVTEYALSPGITLTKPPQPLLPLTLRLAPLSASQMYLSTNIYYVDDAYRRNPYAYSRWVDAPVRMLQLVLQDGLEQSGLFKAVLPSTSMLVADLRLETTIYDFSHHLEPDGKSEAVVRLGFHLLDAHKAQLLASRQFEVRIPAVSRNAEGAVMAMNQAVAALLPQLADWLRDVLGHR
ncbi:ABC-type transport auxiliary lipoprotein family protein [Thiolapillus brandeum]|uniref:ABC-type uncharacterized transport system auxiliary component-l n=1 Tax=Thiolapillus brandeum TaxID=1076588 RepID=A0A7U6GHN6_9GAMM|nr:ABC-type transport auxiliary lipoprotein family protein [Thiolapillus brandeum]BAO43818.1 ABC-type uncharacterized transport system auxiliary component-l [Thiolapillus brandeum]